MSWKEFFIPNKQKIKIFLIELFIVVILVAFYLFILKQSQNLNNSSSLQLFYLSMSGVLMIFYLIVTLPPSIPMYILNLKWPFKTCDFLGSCPNNWGLLVIAIFWIIILYLISCLFSYNKNKNLEKNK